MPFNIIGFGTLMSHEDPQPREVLRILTLERTDYCFQWQSSRKGLGEILGFWGEPLMTLARKERQLYARCFSLSVHASRALRSTNDGSAKRLQIAICAILVLKEDAPLAVGCQDPFSACLCRTYSSCSVTTAAATETRSIRSRSVLITTHRVHIRDL